MNYDMNLIKYHKNVFFRIASVILIVCFTLFWVYRLRWYY